MLASGRRKVTIHGRERASERLPRTGEPKLLRPDRVSTPLGSILDGPCAYSEVMLTATWHVRRGFKAAGFGGVALFAVIYYASAVPKLQKDVLQVRCPRSVQLCVFATGKAGETCANTRTEDPIHRQLLRQRDPPGGQRKQPLPGMDVPASVLTLPHSPFKSRATLGGVVRVESCWREGEVIESDQHRHWERKSIRLGVPVIPHPKFYYGTYVYRLYSPLS